MPNRLASETSPYLLQHANDPVDWWPWCDQALTLARELDKPILLSLGFSTCHWCHVMARESFADDEVAALMNRHFINIKVDREERPDLDYIYQAAHQLLVGRPGGWPLTVFLTPDTTPFLAGAYYPKTPRHRLPGFMDVLRDVAQAYAAQREGIESQNAQLRKALTHATAPVATADVPDAAALGAAAREVFAQTWDRRFGGFGDAPKFPRPTDLALLLRYAAREETAPRPPTGVLQRLCAALFRPAPQAGEMAVSTLERMAEGGLFDQVGGGFFRYSTDERWEIPHFEKLLCDNAALVSVYTQAWAQTKIPLFAQVVEQTIAWTLREMRAPGGGFCSALDAEAHGAEGGFYVWSREDVRAHVAPEASRCLERHWGLRRRANFDSGRWHLRVDDPLAQAARACGLGEGAALAARDAARQALLAARAERPQPGRDDKILTGWNALMIGAMAHAARCFERPDWMAAARETLDLVRAKAWRHGCLHALANDGASTLEAYLDDHAFLLAALLEVLQTDFRAEDLAFACTLADTLIEAFEDVDHGGFFLTRHDHEALLLRPKPMQDATSASGNGVAALSLQRLGHLVGEPRYLTAAQRTLRAGGRVLEQAPAGCASLVLALEEYAEPPAVLVVHGEEARAWQRAVVRLAVPGLICVAPGHGGGPLPVSLAQSEVVGTVAALCRGTHCETPLSDYAALEARLLAR